MKRAFLIGERVYLRPLERSDIGEGWHDWINDPFNNVRLWTPYPQNLESMEAYFEANQPPNAVMFAVCDRSNDRLVGNARLSEFNWVHRSCNYGRLIGPEFQGMGFGSDALLHLLRYGFYSLGMNRIWSSAWIDNEISLASNRKMGMVEEGVLRQFVFKGGQFHDAVVLAMLREDFERVHGGPERWAKHDESMRDEAQRLQKRSGSGGA